MFRGVNLDNVFKGDFVNNIKERLDSGKVKVTDTDQYAWTLLMYSIYYNAKKCFDLLLKYKSNINHVDENGRTPIFLSMFGDKVYIASRLIEERADLEATSYESPLGTRLRNTGCVYCDPIVKMLLLAGAKLENVSKDIIIPSWIYTFLENIEHHRQMAFVVYAAQRVTPVKNLFPPKDIIMIISKMMWEKRKF